MKSMIKAVLVGGFIMAAQGAMADVSAFPSASDDAGNYLPARITYASQHASDRVTNVVSAFPGASDDAGNYLVARTTHADLHAKDPVTNVASAFPGASDDAGNHLPARTTYADTHLGNPVAFSQPAQAADTGAD